MSGVIYKPTGAAKNVERIDVKGSCRIEWRTIDEKRKYYAVCV